MSNQKPGLPKGTRDFGPEQMGRRNFIFDQIKSTFQKFGFQPLETPSMENLSVLTGKYGDEGDQLLFKILNSGDFLAKTSVDDFKAGAKEMLPKISEKGLRYDLTVPFARYVAMNRQLTFPFKRYQIQPVWRADRPQKGRYREFYQCDADVVGTESLLCESEIVLMITEVFEKLRIQDYTIKINNRKVLQGLASLTGHSDMESAFYVAIDKLDKVGKEKVLEELIEKGFTPDSLKKLEPLFTLQGSNEEKLEALKTILSDSEAGLKGISEMEEVISYLHDFKADLSKVDFDVTLARGLSYYTGAIFEVKVNNVQIGSVSGGGRYDNLTGVFGLDGVPGVGFSFGVDRIYDVMDELGLFPKASEISTQLLVINFDKESQKHALPLLSQARSGGIRSEIFPESTKMKKQLNYANKKNIPFVLIVGPEEIKSEKYTLKNMLTGDQFSDSIEEIIAKINATELPN